MTLGTLKPAARIAEPQPAPSRWIDSWPAVVILAGVGATVVWDLLFSWLVWAAILWMLG
jgi:hypothetical protein